MRSLKLSISADARLAASQVKVAPASARRWVISRRRRMGPTLLAALAGALTIAAGAAAPASADPFEDGVVAEGRGDRQAAISAYREAAEGGVGAAEFALGRLYMTGPNPLQDYTQALGWFERAAAQDNPGAQYELGVMYEIGEGTTRDPAKAASWFLRSATHGYAPAEVSLADMFEKGVGVARDFAQAVRWATPAAQAGDVAAQLKLGTLYVEAARQVPGREAGLTSSQFHSVMDQIFGRGNWRETGGYRTPARENELRAEGAGTVSSDTLSRHSLGTPGAPGAYDVVVANMSIGQAAARLLSSGVRFRRVFPEGIHGSQGPHLHVEPLLKGASQLAVGGFVDEALSASQAEDLQPSALDYEHAQYWLQLAAKNGSVEARTILATLGSGAAPREVGNKRFGRRAGPDLRAGDRDPQGGDLGPSPG